MKKLFFILPLVACAFLVACSSDDDEPSVKYNDVSIVWDKTYTIPNGSKAKWTSSNELIASVDGATVKAEHVGDAIIKSDKGSFKVTVTPTVNIYKDVCLDWGCSKSNVKSFMSSFTISKEETDKIYYNGSGAVMLYYYSFKNGGLAGTGVAINGDMVSTDNIATFYKERYIPVTVDEENNTFYFVTPDKKTVLGLTLSYSGRTLVYMAIYIPYSGSGRTIDNFKTPCMNFSNLDLQKVPTSIFNEFKSKF